MINILFTIAAFATLKWMFVKLSAHGQRRVISTSETCAIGGRDYMRPSPALGGLASVHGREPEPRSYFYQVGEGIGLHLLHHSPTMSLDGYLADAELRANLLIR